MNKEYYMQLALNEAKKGLTSTCPNPAVGCVIVKDSRILSRGYHHKAGMPHAEIEALKQLNFNAKNCDVYVTLEPCSHYGKTPPCCDELIKAGVKNVFISVQDPNPKVNGSGIDKLLKNNINVEVGILKESGEELLKYFTHQLKHHKPYVTLKSAISINGFINKEKGIRTKLTGSEAYENTLEIRNYHDAVLVGSNTVLIDNPSFKGMKKIILSNKKLDKSLNIFKTEGEVIQYSDINLNDLLDDLYKKNIGSLLVEGGGQIFNQFIEQNLYNELIVYIAPMLFSSQNQRTDFYSGIKDVNNLKLKKIKTMKEDVMLCYENTNPFN